MDGYGESRILLTHGRLTGLPLRQSFAAASMEAESVRWTATAPASEELRRNSAPAGALLLGGGVVIFGLAIWAFYLGLTGTPLFHPFDLLLIGVGCFLVFLGVYAVFGGRKARMPALSAVGVSNEGLILRWVSGDPTILRWDDPKFRLKISDMRDYRPSGSGRLVSYLTISGRSGGLTVEACDALLEGAREHRLAIKSRPWRGSWGEVGRYQLGPRGKPSNPERPNGS